MSTRMLRIWRKAKRHGARFVLLGTVVVLSAAVLLTYFAPWDEASDAASFDAEEAALALVAEQSRSAPGAFAPEPGVPRRAPNAFASSGPEMAITLSGGGFCTAGQCYAATSSSFTLAVEVVEKPANDYAVIQTYLDYGVYDPTANEDGAGPDSCGDGIENGLFDGADRLDDDCVTVALVYTPSVEPEDEILWEDLNTGVALRFEEGPGLLAHGGMTGLIPPVPISDYEGVIIELHMACPATAAAIPVSLLLYDDPLALNNGSMFGEPDLVTPVIPKLSSITMNCVAPQAHPGDTDGDGCSDADEQGATPALGGDRDWLNPWDFYDVTGDKYIDLFNDIIGVINHIGTAPGPPYDVQYDRGAWTGANSWNGTAPPDGVIDEDIDIDGVFAQYGHDCR